MSSSAALALIEFTARRVFSGKRLWAAIVLLAIPPLVAALLVALARQRAGTPVHFDGITFNLSLYLTLVLTAMIYGVALTSSEIEDGTAGYVLLGACPRWMVALAHVLVTSPLLAALTTASIAATYGIASISPVGVPERGPSVIATDAFVASVALTVYLAFFVFCGYAFKHNMAVSIGTVLVWEFIMPALPTKFMNYTVVMNTRILWLHLTQQGERGRWFRGVVGFDVPTYAEASMFLSVAAALFLTLGMVAAMNRSLAGREGGT